VRAWKARARHRGREDTENGIGKYGFVFSAMKDTKISEHVFMLFMVKTPFPGR
jgi:hypothetical protein